MTQQHTPTPYRVFEHHLLHDVGNGTEQVVAHFPNRKDAVFAGRACNEHYKNKRGADLCDELAKSLERAIWRIKTMSTPTFDEIDEWQAALAKARGEASNA